MNEKDFFERNKDALNAVFKEFGISQGELNGEKGLVYNSASDDDVREMITGLVYLNSKLAEVTLKMYITIESDEPNQEIILAKRFHELMVLSMDRMLTDFIGEVADDTFISKKDVTSS